MYIIQNTVCLHTLIYIIHSRIIVIHFDISFFKAKIKPRLPQWRVYGYANVLVCTIFWYHHRYYLQTFKLNIAKSKSACYNNIHMVFMLYLHPTSLYPLFPFLIHSALSCIKSNSEKEFERKRWNHPSISNC